MWPSDLSTIILSDTDIVGDIIQIVDCMAACNNLEYVSLNNTMVGGKIDKLSKLPPSLVYLDVSGTEVRERGREREREREREKENTKDRDYELVHAHNYRFKGESECI